ncbi:MAG: hypothetical protein JWN70_3690, partial [Planctomycetaceae bacterium]|nr:hypothetical protein [Planctomycetaceae bacterium]
RGLVSWLAIASWTYPLFGITAGLISAVVLFRFRDRRGSDVESQVR